MMYTNNINVIRKKLKLQLKSKRNDHMILIVAEFSPPYQDFYIYDYFEDCDYILALRDESILDYPQYYYFPLSILENKHLHYFNQKYRLRERKEELMKRLVQRY